MTAASHKNEMLGYLLDSTSFVHFSDLKSADING